MGLKVELQDRLPSFLEEEEVDFLGQVTILLETRTDENELVAKLFDGKMPLQDVQSVDDVLQEEDAVAEVAAQHSNNTTADISA